VEVTPENGQIRRLADFLEEDTAMSCIQCGFGPPPNGCRCVRTSGSPSRALFSAAPCARP
jgi:hypothetical protein